MPSVTRCRRSSAASPLSAHDERAHIEPLLYHSALQNLLDRIFVMLCEDHGRQERLLANLDRIQPLLES